MKFTMQASFGADRTARALLWLAIISASSLAAAAVVLVPAFAPLRLPVVLWFLLVCPGMALVQWLRLGNRLAEWIIAIGLSVALDTIVAGLMVLSGYWSPNLGLLTLIAVSLAAAGLHLAITSGWLGAMRVVARRDGRVLNRLARGAFAAFWAPGWLPPNSQRGWPLLAVGVMAVLVVAAIRAPSPAPQFAAITISEAAPVGVTPTQRPTFTPAPTLPGESNALVEDATLVAELSATPTDTPSATGSPTDTPAPSDTTGAVATTAPPSTATTGPGVPATPIPPTDTGLPPAEPSATPVPPADTPVPSGTTAGSPPTNPPTATPSNTAVATSTTSPSSSPLPGTPTATPSTTRTTTPAPSATRTPTPPPSATRTNTPLPTATATPTQPPTNTNTPIAPTATNTFVPTSTYTPSPTATDTPVPTDTQVSTRSISGRVHGSGDSGVSGVTILLNSLGSASTGGDGSYSFSGLQSGGYLILPIKLGCTFSPADRYVDVSQGDSGGNDFRAHCIGDLDATAVSILDPLVTLIAPLP